MPHAGANFTGVTFFNNLPVQGANNGLSLDGTNTVLGNDVADLTVPAILLNDREIPTSDIAGANPPFNVILHDYFNVATTSLNGSVVELLSLLTGDSERVHLEVQPGLSIIRQHVAAGEFWISTFAGGTSMAVGFFGGIQSIGIDGTTGNVTIIGTGSQPVANLRVLGSITGSAFFQGVDGAYNIDRNNDRGKLLCNQNASGPVTLNLPNMAFASTQGFFIIVMVDDAQGITVVADAGQTINIGGIVTSVAGTIASNQVGASVALYCVHPARWQAAYSTGAWAFT